MYCVAALGQGCGRCLQIVSEAICAFTRERSLFRQCLNRCKHEDFPPTIVTSSDYRFIVAQQLVDEDISSASIILEPSSKNTAPSIIAAATHISEYDDNGIMVVMPSDHFISDNESH